MTNAQVAENNLENNAKLWVLIPCGGSGSRAQSEIPKQYRVIAGKPMVMHTLAAFEQVERLAGGLVVIAKEDDYLLEILKTSKNTIFSIAPQAGNTRATTVFKGLKALLQHGAAATDWVLVHDAARCLITPEQINALIDACKDDAIGGLLALPLPDTLKSEKAGRVAATLGRSDKWLAQTPQMFKIGALLDALTAAGDLSDTSNALITDESSAMERMGHAPKLVRGSAQNFKVTYPEDFALAEAVLQNRKHSG
ncbi:MAG: 2-C-methyl-D-erythritol 4-phosphate cytidylyltransferase [Burkholderiaceae bacterium]